MIYKMIGWILVTLTLNGCASDGVGRRLDQKLSQEPVTLSRSDVHTSVTQWINDSNTLNADQKTRLASLRESIVSQEEVLQHKSLKLRSLLIKQLFSDRYDSDEIEVIQNRIKSTEGERLSLLFKAVKQANVILGRYPSRTERQSEEFYNEIMLEIGPTEGFYF